MSSSGDGVARMLQARGWQRDGSSASSSGGETLYWTKDGQRRSQQEAYAAEFGSVSSAAAAGAFQQTVASTTAAARGLTVTTTRPISVIEKDLTAVSKQIVSLERKLQTAKKAPPNLPEALAAANTTRKALETELADAKLREESLTTTPLYPESFSTIYRAINLGSIVHTLRAKNPERPTDLVNGEAVDLNWMNWILNRPNEIVTVLVPRVVPPPPKGISSIATEGFPLSDVPDAVTFLLRAVTRNPVSDSAGTKLLLFNDGVNFGDLDPIREYLQARGGVEKTNARSKLLNAGDLRIVVSQASLNDSSLMDSQKRNASAEDYLCIWAKDVVPFSGVALPAKWKPFLDESERIRSLIADKVKTISPVPADATDTAPIASYTTTKDDITLIPGVGRLGDLDPKLKDVVAIHFLRRIPIEPLTGSANVNDFRSAVSAHSAGDTANSFGLGGLAIPGEDYYVQHGVYLRGPKTEHVICSRHRSNVGPSADVLYEAMLPYLGSSDPPAVKEDAAAHRMFQPQYLAYQVYQWALNEVRSKDDAKRLVYHVLSLKKAGADLLNGAIASQCTTFVAERPPSSSSASSAAAATPPEKIFTQLMTPDGGSFLGYVKTWRVPCVLRKSDGYPVTNRIGSVPPAVIVKTTNVAATQSQQPYGFSLATVTELSPERPTAQFVATSGPRAGVKKSPVSDSAAAGEEEAPPERADELPLYHLYRLETGKGKRVRYIVDNVPVPTADQTGVEPGFVELKLKADGTTDSLQYTGDTDSLEELFASNSYDEILTFLGTQVGLDFAKLLKERAAVERQKEEAEEDEETQKYLTAVQSKLESRAGTGKDEIVRMRLKMLQESEETTVSEEHNDLIYTMLRNESPRTYTSYGHARYPLRESTFRSDGYNALMCALDAWKDIYLRKEAKYAEVVKRAKEALAFVVGTMCPQLDCSDLLASMLKNPQAYEAVLQTAGYVIQKEERGLEPIQEEEEEEDSSKRSRETSSSSPYASPPRKRRGGGGRRGTFRKRHSAHTHRLTYKRRHI